jgi:hypothetical protein
MSNEFTDYDRRSFEHAAREETGSSKAEVVEVDDDKETVTLEVDDGRVTMQSDDLGLPHVVED